MKQEENQMMMEIYFSKEKALEHKLSIKKIYQAIDEFFEERNVKKIGEGVYLTTEKNAGAFILASAKFPKTSWFLKIIDQWYWREEGISLEDRIDCLKEYYEVQALS